MKALPTMTRRTLVVVALLATTAGWAAIQPANPDLIPEARRVLDYLESVYGKRTLTGMAATAAGGPSTR
jgi:hypothetical protein